MCCGKLYYHRRTRPNPTAEEPAWGPQTPAPEVKGEVHFQVSAQDDYLNVMESMMPRVPNFPQVSVKEGKVRGFVADLNGNPLAGAFVGVRSSAVGGYYSSASAETDENGYYEILVPWGATHFWSGGYTIDYGTGRAALSLYPADSKLESFESTTGKVKNFVLLSYGLADADHRAEKPWSSGGYFGGALFLNYNIGDPDDIWAARGSLPPDAEILITLTPLETLYGESRSFVITKKVGSTSLSLNNIPIGRYTISASLKDGRQLKLRQTGPYVSTYPHHGLKPKEATGSAEVLFTPMGVEASSALPNYGGWRPVDIKLELPY
ncbi:carboxypeptidase-like regulatory domain-containing protein [Cesiribacter sp. SM1]|uniref:carboxypeptidase-like regulatory domain-containing protein n=1 Tax=Cesiribacter sp. SM1 TaxID=2861196 RepID=UPI001CD445BB|nr:carboxypeptidase-like regulatory domain-containing protein [Cesiribacter sp. SM1]